MTATHAPLLSACAQRMPSGTLFSGASAVILTEISPVLLTENECDVNPCGVTVPLNSCIWFLEGSTMPPQLIVKKAAAASASAAALKVRTADSPTGRAVDAGIGDSGARRLYIIANPMPLLRARKTLVALAILAAFALAFVLTPPRASRSMREFNPARLADLEVRMWQAYYAKQRARLFGLLVTTLREQYH